MRIPTWTTDAGLLLLRLSIGSMMLFSHGLPKLLGFSEKAAEFSDPLGVGPTTSLALAILGEVVGSAFVILGFGTRIGALLLAITMLVAALLVHTHDPWARKELALLYAAPAIALMFAGGGRFSIESWIASRRKRASDRKK